MEKEQTKPKTEEKVETPKQETKEETKKEKPAEETKDKTTKETKKPKKEKQIIKKVKLKTTKEKTKIKKELKKKSTQHFKGRFGQRQKRKKCIAKWDKWRKSRGNDIKRKKEDGAIPQPGYQTPKKIRYLHPSGYEEVTIETPTDLTKIKENCIARIASTVGRKKREKIMKDAFSKGIKIIN